MPRRRIVIRLASGGARCSTARLTGISHDAHNETCGEVSADRSDCSHRRRRSAASRQRGTRARAEGDTLRKVENHLSGSW